MLLASLNGHVITWHQNCRSSGSKPLNIVRECMKKGEKIFVLQMIAKWNVNGNRDSLLTNYLHLEWLKEERN